MKLILINIIIKDYDDDTACSVKRKWKMNNIVSNIFFKVELFHEKMTPCHVPSTSPSITLCH